MTTALRPLWTPQDLAGQFRVAEQAAWHATGVATDSREITPGDLFVALAGAEADGHAYVAHALASGAAAALVHRLPPELADDDPRLVFCNDSFEGLRALARLARARTQARLIAVTGSAGKTGTVRVLDQALRRTGLTHASVRSFNNHVGVPLTLARMHPDARFGVFEIGMNAPGEIDRLTALVRPHVALVTSIGAAHIAAFDDLAGIAQEKAAIYGHLAPGGAALVNLDTSHASHLLARARCAGAERLITCSLQDDDADIFPFRLAWQGDGTAMAVRLMRSRVAVRVGVPGHAWAGNALMILAAVEAAGGDVVQAGLALAGLKPGPGRGRRTRLVLPGGTVTLHDHSYNANPLSLTAALGMLAAEPRAGRRIAVLADMRELGARAEALHRDCAPALTAAGIDQVLALGPMSAMMADAAGLPAQIIASPEDGAAHLLRAACEGDQILVKGANAAGLGRLVARLTAQGAAALPAEGRDAMGWAA